MLKKASNLIVIMMSFFISIYSAIFHIKKIIKVKVSYKLNNV